MSQMRSTSMSLRYVLSTVWLCSRPLFFLGTKHLSTGPDSMNGEHVKHSNSTTGKEYTISSNKKDTFIEASCLRPLGLKPPIDLRHTGPTSEKEMRYERSCRFAYILHISGYSTC